MKRKVSRSVLSQRIFEKALCKLSKSELETVDEAFFEQGE
jgi:hypothetical protein